jgi:transglutaminase-like putative cysteine protease
MSLGRVALGLVGIGFGVSQLRKARSSNRLGGLSGAMHASTPSGQIRLRTHKIKGLSDRIHHLRKLVEQGKRDPVVYEFARRAVNQKCGGKWCVPEKATAKEAEALFKHIRKHVRYTSDIAGIDSYQKPSHTIRLGTGDCDDYSTLTCAAAATLGIPCRFKVIRTKGAPDWNHIYAELGFPRRAPQKWVPFDASVEMPFGWEAPPQMVEAAKIFHL